jgi:hypothetical protein
MDMRLRRGNQRSSFKHARQSSADDVVILVTNHVLDECTARIVFETPVSRSTDHPAVEARASKTATLIGTAADGRKRKPADVLDSGEHSVTAMKQVRLHHNIEDAALDSDSSSTLTSVASSASVLTRLSSDVTVVNGVSGASDAAPRSGHPDGQLKNTFPLLASMILAPSTVADVGGIRIEAQISRHSTPPGSLVAVPDQQQVVIIDEKTDEQFAAFNLIQDRVVTIKQSPMQDAVNATENLGYDCTYLMSPQSQQHDPTYNICPERQTSPDSSTHVDWGQDLMVTSTERCSDVGYATVNEDQSAVLPELDENSLNSVLSCFNDRALDQLMMDFMAQNSLPKESAVPCSLAGSSSSSSSNSSSSSAFGIASSAAARKLLNDGGVHQLADAAAALRQIVGGISEDDSSAVTSSDCASGGERLTTSGAADAAAADTSRKLSDLLSVYRRVVSLAVMELLKNQLTSQCSTGTLLSLLPVGMRQLKTQAASDGQREPSSPMLLEALALNDITAELLTMLNRNNNGGSGSLMT